MQKNKIIFFIGSLGGGGAERVVCNLANYLKEKEWDISILTMSDKKASYFLNQGIKLYSLIAQSERKNFVYNLILRYMRFRKYVKTESMDCFVVMLPVTILMSLILRRRISGKLIISERDDPNSYSGVMQCLLKAFSHRADGFVFQTKDAYKWYGKYIGEKKIAVIPNAVNKEFLTVDKNVVRENRIIAAGRLVEKKNFGLLIKAYAKIADKYPDYKLVIFGDGAEKDTLQRLSVELNMESNVVLSGYTDNLKEEFQKSKLFVLSSNYEGIPNTLVEAMALGLPCIATDCPAGGPKFLIQHGINGYLTGVGDMEQMAYYMDLLLSSEKLAGKIGKKAQDITKTLNQDKIYPDWEGFIKEVISD